ncbi:agmatine deiminase family protein [Streptomyces lavendulae]|uniref:agmatine deiminase family protein n=1 Tax=Streptomyces lavendulae TaxID=1914 RepID=UPI00372198D0
MGRQARRGTERHRGGGVRDLALRTGRDAGPPRSGRGRPLPLRTRCPVRHRRHRDRRRRPNYYTANGAVIAPRFGDAAADGLAYSILQAAYPDRQVVQVRIDNIASGGGGIHCATQSHPAVPPAV